jgi:hypothetical protein
VLGELEDPLVVCAWGVHGKHLGQGETAMRWISAAGVIPHVLTRTKEGEPGHPLYLKQDLEPCALR